MKNQGLYFVVSVLTLLGSQACAQMDLAWSPDNEILVFRDDSADRHTYYAVDVPARKKRVAFDHDQVAKSLSGFLGKEIDSSRLPIQNVIWTDDLQMVIQSGKRFFGIDQSNSEMTEVDQRIVSNSDSRFFRSPRPGRNGESTNIVIENQCDFPMELFWYGPNRREVSYGTLNSGQQIAQHTYVGHVWILKSKGKIVACFETRLNDHVLVTKDELRNARTEKTPLHQPIRFPIRHERNFTGQTSPDGIWKASVGDDHNLYIQKIGTDGADERVQLSDNGTFENTFERIGSGTRWLNGNRRRRKAGDLSWSPNSKYLIAFQTKRVEEPKVHYIESLPKDQLQPKLQSYQYPKPGAELQTQTLRLFAVESQKEIAVSNERFRNPFSLQRLGWSDSGDKFWLLYNERGHQCIRLLEVDAASGSVDVVVEEKAETFLHYSNPSKLLCLELLADESKNQQVLWASERSGWNHLYRIDVTNRKILNPVTQGNWNVNRVLEVDRIRQRIIFVAVGVVEDQDPYHEHLCSVNFDGSDLKILTKGDGTHRIEFIKNVQYFIDTYSRVDLAPVVELRETETGDLIAELNRRDAKAEFGKRKLTERFVAKGRDGQTDIWGIIHWPKDFDPAKTYPIVENIYAGPHGYHVPKSFRTRYFHQHQIADAGMIVVQIDGMGTAWRSKAFHDVCYKNLRDSGFPDRIAWIKAAAEKHPQMDVSRVGIYGGSAGGQSAMAALLWHNDFYSVAVADCGCHDNRMDKIWWNEQWMGWPVDESYVANSNKENAHLLKGHLMLTLGELDRNVDPASTTQVVHELIKYDKDFEFVLVAGKGHGAGETPWATKKRLNFFKTHLQHD